MLIFIHLFTINCYVLLLMGALTKILKLVDYGQRHNKNYEMRNEEIYFINKLTITTSKQLIIILCFKKVRNTLINLNNLLFG